jgi:hypothetical protein
MKTIQKLFALGLILLFVAPQGIRAQGPSPYREAINLLTDFNVTASQAQAKAQQVATFASNGNMPQFEAKLADLQRDIAELDGITSALLSARVPDRSYSHSLINLRVDVMASGNVFSRLGSGPWSTAVVGSIGAVAVGFREAMERHKGTAQEIRVALCCAD